MFNDNPPIRGRCRAADSAAQLPGDYRLAVPADVADVLAAVYRLILSWPTPDVDPTQPVEQEAQSAILD